MTRKIHESEYASNDYCKYNLDPPEYKRGSRHNKIGMWIMFIFYGIIIVQLLHAFTVIPFFPITFTILSGIGVIFYVAWRAS